jgi:N6-adenosine-specific RNA methylase IME4
VAWVDNGSRIRSADVLPRSPFSVVYADPPWHWKTRSPKGDGRAPPYQRMSLEQLWLLPVAQLAAPNCALFLWAIDSMLPEALSVISAWGFRYKTIAFTWAKTGKNGGFPIGCGYWTRANPEMCLLGTRGHPKRLHRDVPQLVVASRHEHSRKPGVVAERIERLMGGPYVELFARGPRPGWTVWGDEARGKRGKAPVVSSRGQRAISEQDDLFKRRVVAANTGD